MEAHTPLTQPASIGRRMLMRLLSLWRVKLSALIAMVVWICVPYVAVSRIHLRPAFAMPFTSLDRAIPFQPAWTIAYVLLYPFMILAALFYTNRRDLLRYVAAVAATSAIACAIFLFWPTAVPRPVVSQPPLLYSLIRNIDLPMNACPSLHAGFAILAALAFEPLLRGRRFERWLVRSIAWTLALLIIYSTLPTHQHVLMDLVAGAVLGAGTWSICVRLFTERRKPV